MTIDGDDPTGLTQAVKIYTDLERSYPSIICPITATLSPNKAFITLSTNYDLITILHAQITKP